MNDYPCRDQNVKVAQEGSLVESGQPLELGIAHGLAGVEQSHDGFRIGDYITDSRFEAFYRLESIETRRWGDSDHAAPEDERVKEILDQLGVKLYSRVGPGGHEFDTWDPMMQEVLDYLMKEED